VCARARARACVRAETYWRKVFMPNTVEREVEYYTIINFQ